MRIAAYNIQNLFLRPAAFNKENADEANNAIQATNRLNEIFQLDVYSDENKAEILDLAEKLRFNRYDEGELVYINKTRGSLIKRPRNSNPYVVAEGRNFWIGWAALKKAPIDEIAMHNTTRVIRDVDADILALVEVENRFAFEELMTEIFKKVKDEIDEEPTPYKNIMLIEGNDKRGIDVMLTTKENFRIGLTRSHINDHHENIKPEELEGNVIPESIIEDDRPIFCRDCPEYAVTTPSGELIWVLPNHFKSKFGHDFQKSNDKRTSQSIFTRAIYERLRKEGHENIVVLGDLNDTPDSDPLQPLLANSDLREVSDHPLFDTGEFKGREGTNERGYGTYKLGNDNQKIDYILLSPALFDRVTAAGLFRKGAWPGSSPIRWTVYPELTEQIHAASDHHVIWVDID